MSGKGSVLPPGVGPYQCGECELNVKKSQRTSAMVVQHWVRHHSVGQGSEPGNIRFRDISTGQVLFARNFYLGLARCRKCRFVFGFNDEGMKWAKFRHHYNKHLTWKTKHSTEEMDEEMTASLVNLPLSQPAPAPAPVLVQEDGVTLKDTEPSREPLELGSESDVNDISGATEAGTESIQVQQGGGGRDDPIPVRVDGERNLNESGTTKVKLDDVICIETTDEESDHEEMPRKKIKSNREIISVTKSLHLEEYDELFESEKIDVKILSEMDHTELRSIGVKQFGDRHRLLRKARGIMS